MPKNKPAAAPRNKPSSAHQNKSATPNDKQPSVSLFKPREAATMLGISYPTVKQWILNGKLKTVVTPGGHHRIAEAALKPLLPAAQKTDKRDQREGRERYRRVSGRNQLLGKVVEVKIDGLLAKVVLRIGDDTITSIITADAARELALKKGDTAAALIKSTDVMVERP